MEGRKATADKDDLNEIFTAVGSEGKARWQSIILHEVADMKTEPTCMPMFPVSFPYKAQSLREVRSVGAYQKTKP